MLIITKKIPATLDHLHKGNNDLTEYRLRKNVIYFFDILIVFINRGASGTSGDAVPPFSPQAEIFSTLLHRAR
jgi:hypothetical protein